MLSKFLKRIWDKADDISEPDSRYLIYRTEKSETITMPIGDFKKIQKETKRIENNVRNK